MNFIWIPKECIPPKYRELLDHNQATTLMLESFYHQKMFINVLEGTISGNVYKREIIMFGGQEHIPRELAYIEIFLENLPDESIRKEIMEKKRPFGKILVDYKIETTREIKAFLRFYKDERILKYTDNPDDFLYGKEYSIWLLSEKTKLANVIEIYF